MTIVEDYTAIEKEGDKTFFVTRYKEEINSDDVRKRVAFLEANVKTLRGELDKMDIDEALAMMDKKLEVDRQVKQTALRNFDKFITEQILDLKHNKEKQKAQIRTELLRFDEFKEKELAKMKHILEHKKAEQEHQLKNDEKQLRAYKGEAGQSS